METLLITTKNKSELQFVSEFLKRMHIESKRLSNEEIEDLALGKAIEEGMNTKTVPKSSIIKALKRK